MFFYETKQFIKDVKRLMEDIPKVTILISKFNRDYADLARDAEKFYKVSAQLEEFVELCNNMNKIIDVYKSFISEDSEVEKAWKKFAKEKGYVV